MSPPTPADRSGHGRSHVPDASSPSVCFKDKAPLLEEVESAEHVYKRARRLKFPTGFQFDPSDRDLIIHYLDKKLAKRPLPLEVMHDVNLYKFHPKDLTENYEKGGEDKWYFFTPRDQKYPNGIRPNRTTLDGFWKATGADNHIMHNDSLIGRKKTLVYHEGKPPGIKTQWTMHEFTRNYEVEKSQKPKGKIKLQELVLCRIQLKRESKRKQVHQGDNRIAVAPSTQTMAKFSDPPRSPISIAKYYGDQSMSNEPPLDSYLAISLYDCQREPNGAKLPLKTDNLMGANYNYQSLLNGLKLPLMSGDLIGENYSRHRMANGVNLPSMSSDLNGANYDRQGTAYRLKLPPIFSSDCTLADYIRQSMSNGLAISPVSSCHQLWDSAFPECTPMMEFLSTEARVPASARVFSLAKKWLDHQPQPSENKHVSIWEDSCSLSTSGCGKLESTKGISDGNIFDTCTSGFMGLEEALGINRPTLFGTSTCGFMELESVGNEQA